MMLHPAQRADAGYTLLEVLVALVVLGFILAGLAQGTHFGLLAWRSGTRLSAANDDLTILDTTLRHVIEGADPGDELDPAPFIGAQDRLGCITALPNAAGPTPHRHIQALLLVDAGHRLVLRWRPFMPAERIKPLPPPTETVLTDGVARLRISYWRPGGSWLDTWRASDLPALVRLRVEFTDGNRRHWPDIVAATRLNRP